MSWAKRQLKLHHRRVQWTKQRDICSGCGPMMNCPLCGNNCCNGGYGEWKGKKCPMCPLTYRLQDAWYGRRGKQLKQMTDEAEKALLENRKRLEAEGVKFATMDDLKELL